MTNTVGCVEAANGAALPRGRRIAGRGRADAHEGRPGVEKGVPIIGVDSKSFTMQLLPAQKPVTSPVELAVTPTSRGGVAGRETPRNSESPTFSQVLFFLPLRDSGSTETVVRMSLRCPQVCATGRLERPFSDSSPSGAPHHAGASRVDLELLPRDCCCC